MGQEFVIKSTVLEDKINELLPAQGGYEPGVDLSASTQIIPVVDLTEAASGSTLRQDLQSSFSHDVTTAHSVVATSNSTLQNTTGYWRIFGNTSVTDNANGEYVAFNLFDGTTRKQIWKMNNYGTNGASQSVQQYLDFIVCLEAGDSIEVDCNGTYASFFGASRQIASIAGVLTNPV